MPSRPTVLRLSQVICSYGTSLIWYAGHPFKASSHCRVELKYVLLDSVRPLYHVGESEQHRSTMAESTTTSLDGLTNQFISTPISSTLLQPALMPEPSGHAGMNPEGSESDIQFECDLGMWQYQYATLEHPYPIDPLTNNNHNHELSPAENSNTSLPLLQDDLLPADMHFVPDFSPQQLH